MTLVDIPVNMQPLLVSGVNQPCNTVGTWCKHHIVVPRQLLEAVYIDVHNHPQPNIAVHGPTQPYIALHSHTQPYITLHTHTQPYIALHTHTQPYIALHSPTQPYTALHSHTQPQPYIALHSHTQPYIALHRPTQQYIAIHSPPQPYTAIHSPTQPYNRSKVQSVLASLSTNFLLGEIINKVSEKRWGVALEFLRGLGLLLVWSTS